jgi:hypothetical protein
MSANFSPVAEERTASALRTAIDPVAPSMSLDTSALLRAGRHYRRRRTAMVSTLGALAVGAVVFGGFQLSGLNRATTLPLATPDPLQTPHSIGPGQVHYFTPGILAVNRPIKRALADGTTVLDLGFSNPGDRPTSARLEAVLVEADAGVLRGLRGADAAARRPAIDYGAGVEFAELDQTALRLDRGWTLAWKRAEPADPHVLTRTDYMAHTGMIYGNDGSQVTAGVVPAWLRDPRVIAFSSQGFRTASGAIVHALELPTFAAPTGDRRLLYALKIAGNEGFDNTAADGSQGAWESVNTVAFIGSDGEVVLTDECAGQTVRQCNGVSSMFSDAIAPFLPQTN